MRIRGRVLVSSCTVLLAAGLLTGCAGADHEAREHTPTASPTPTPVFTSDADALAAATEVYKRFLRTEAAVGHDGGQAPERLKIFLNSEGYESELKQSESLAKDRAKTVGEARLNNVSLQAYTESGGVARIRLYVCQDLSDVDIVDDEGHSLVSATRADLVAYEVEVSGPDESSLLITQNSYWTGGGICKP